MGEYKSDFSFFIPVDGRIVPIRDEGKDSTKLKRLCIKLKKQNTISLNVVVGVFVHGEYKSDVSFYIPVDGSTVPIRDEVNSLLSSKDSVLNSKNNI